MDAGEETLMTGTVTKTGKVVAVIPARYGSTRFPGKVLAPLCGKPMIQWVYEQAVQTQADEVVIATDNDLVRRVVEDFGGRCVMTRADHATGTDRIAEAIADLDADWILNVQGDEPLVPPAVLDQLIVAMRERGSEMGTVAVPIDPDGEAFRDPNVVKVVLDRAHNALYFSRAPIAYARGDRPAGAAPLHHWGIYLYRRDFLEQFVRWPQGDLERCESLEQLRALENGAKIFVLVTQVATIGVDTPADLHRAEARLKAMLGQ